MCRQLRHNEPAMQEKKNRQKKSFHVKSVAEKKHRDKGNLGKAEEIHRKYSKMQKKSEKYRGRAQEIQIKSKKMQRNSIHGKGYKGNTKEILPHNEYN